jgi:GTP-binding protein Era
MGGRGENFISKESALGSCHNPGMDKDSIMDISKNSSTGFLSGFIAIVGPPNVGKSTLLNRLMGKKVAIVSPKPQTTRNRILGVRHGEGYQMAFLDTPGIHKTKTPLHNCMVSSAREALSQVDILLLVIAMSPSDDPEISSILNNIKKTKKPVILVINKIDKAPKENLLPVMESYSDKFPFDAIVPVSALKGEGIDTLLEELKKKIRPGPQFFPKDMTTDQPDTFLVSEIIREKIYLCTGRDIPYSSAVTVERMEGIDEKGLLSISAVIHVETESQKVIMIGRRGEKVRNIGRDARLELEKIFGSRIYLELFVRVEKNWSRDPKALRKLGY